MPYQDKHSLLIDCMKTPYAWRSLNRLQDDLHQLQLLQFSCSFDRKGMRAILLSILSGTAEDSLEPVFDLHQRFPGCFNYVYLHAPKYVKATLGMLMALDHQDTPNELTVSDKGISMSELYVDRAIFYRNLVKLKKGIAKADYVYNRLLFEKKFDLTWHDE